MTIKEAAQKTGISADNLRYYERIGLIPPVPRKENGIRDFDQRTLEWIDFVIKFKRAGMSLESIAEYMRLATQGDSTRAARKEILQQTRNALQKKLEELQEAIAFADYKINDFYGDCVSATDRLFSQSGPSPQ